MLACMIAAFTVDIIATGPYSHMSEVNDYGIKFKLFHLLK